MRSVAAARMPTLRCSLPLLLAFAIIPSIFQGGANAQRAEKTVQVVPGCFRKGHKVTCRSWTGPDAPEIPASFPWRDFIVLDLSSMDAARKIEIASRGGTCGKQAAADGAAPQGLGASLSDGRLPARWLSPRYENVVVLYLRGAGLRALHRDAFEALKNVQHVYLGSNLLERLDPDIWLHNSRISAVSLEHNMALQVPEDQPLFNSDTIEYLDLSGCGLRAVPQRAFEGLPRLQTLRLERNCLRAVPAEALVPVSDLWSLGLGENAIESVTEEDAQLVARLPDAVLHGNPWRCDCALRSTLRALQGDSRQFWDQTMQDLVCLWPPEEVQRPWSVVLNRDSCREYNETLENATSTSTSTSDGNASSAANGSTASEPPPNGTAGPQTAASQAGAGAGAGAGASAHCSACAGGDATFCKWTTVGVLLFLVFGVLAFVLAVFTGRVALTVSLVGARSWPKRADRSPSRSNLTENSHENSDYLHDIESSPRDEGDQRPLVVHFGRGS